MKQILTRRQFNLSILKELGSITPDKLEKAKLEVLNFPESGALKIKFELIWDYIIKFKQVPIFGREGYFEYPNYLIINKLSKWEVDIFFLVLEHFISEYRKG